MKGLGGKAMKIDQLVQKMEDTHTGRKSWLEATSKKVCCRSQNVSGQDQQIAMDIANTVRINTGGKCAH
jgi:hypothetical protein